MPYRSECNAGSPHPTGTGTLQRKGCSQAHSRIIGVSASQHMTPCHAIGPMFPKCPKLILVWSTWRLRANRQIGRLPTPAATATAQSPSRCGEWTCLPCGTSTTGTTTPRRTSRPPDWRLSLGSAGKNGVPPSRGEGGSHGIRTRAHAASRHNTGPEGLGLQSEEQAKAAIRKTGRGPHALQAAAGGGEA